MAGRTSPIQSHSRPAGTSCRVVWASSLSPWCWRTRERALPLSGSVDVQTHGPGRALDDPGGMLEIVGVEVGLLDLGDLAHLRLREGPDLVAVRVPRALINTGGLLQ